MDEKIKFDVNLLNLKKDELNVIIVGENVFNNSMIDPYNIEVLKRLHRDLANAGYKCFFLDSRLVGGIDTLSVENLIALRKQISHELRKYGVK